MKTDKKMIAASLALSLMSSGIFQMAQAEDKEKCGGVVKAGANECAANGHGCHGSAKVDRDPNEWVMMPKGLCEKLAGGKVVKEEDKKKK